MTEAKAEAKTRRKALELQELELTVEAAKVALEKDRLETDARRYQRDYEWAYDARRGYFRFGGTGIDWSSVNEIADATKRYSRIHGTSAPVTVEFSSPGGNVFAGFKLYDDLRALGATGHPVTTICRGYSASMAGILLQAGDQRIIGPESYLMLHEVSTGAIGKAFELKDAADLAERLTRHACTIYARRSNLDANEIYDRLHRRDWWIGAEEAVQLGFADTIG